MSNPWEGKHAWIWVLDRCGTPADIVSRAIALGLTGLLVKGWDDSDYWQEQIEAITGPAKAAGLIVGAWGYSYGFNPAGEAEAAKKCVAAGVDWLVIDAEAEYEKNPGLADGILEAFRDLGVPLGYTSFGIPNYHAGFPWAKFSAACNVVLPQVYWGEFGMSADKALSMSLAYDYGLPVAPAGQCYGSVTPDDIVRFGDLAEAAGLPGISFYDWQHAGPEQLAAVGTAPYKRMVDKVSNWARASWDKAVAKGVLDGTEPQGSVTREMLAMVLDKCGLLDASEVSPEIMDVLKTAGLITEDHPVGARPTWGEMAAVFSHIKGGK